MRRASTFGFLRVSPGKTAQQITAAATNNIESLSKEGNLHIYLVDYNSR